MRVPLAAIFVFALMLGTAWLPGSHYPNGSWPGWTMALPPIAMFSSFFLAVFLFNRRGFRPTDLPRAAGR